MARRPKSQERWPAQAAPEARGHEEAPGGAGGLPAAGKPSGLDDYDIRKKAGPAGMLSGLQSQERWPAHGTTEVIGREEAPGGAGGLPAAGKPSGPDDHDIRRKAGAAGILSGLESQERWSSPAAAEAPGQEETAGGASGLAAAGKRSGPDDHDIRRKAGPAWMLHRAEGQGLGHEQIPLSGTQVQTPGPEAGKGRAAADALNRQIREEVTSTVSSSYRNEFRAWPDIKPVKPIKAKPQYKPPDDKMAHETSYSAQFKGEANKPSPADNKVIDRRRIRSLYSEPFKEPPKD